MSNELDLTKYGDDDRKNWTCTCSTFDRYKGNVAYIINDRSYCVVFDRNLVSDAPLLLAEVKRLRAKLEAAAKQIEEMRNCKNCDNSGEICWDDGPGEYSCSMCPSPCLCKGCGDNLNNWQPKGDER